MIRPDVMFETDVLKLLLCIFDTIALKFTSGLHKLVAIIFPVSFEIMIQRAVGNESCYSIKNTLIIKVLSKRRRKHDLLKLFSIIFTKIFLIGRKYELLALIHREIRAEM
jgi:hypothetical protein